MVTLCAIQRSVGAGKGELGVSFVIEASPLPISRGMTLSACFPEASFVLVLGVVAGKASRFEARKFQPDVARCFSEVAVVAQGVLMLADERKIGFCRVIKDGIAPTGQGMAASAVSAHASQVRILRNVTSLAVTGRLLVTVRRMTEGAVGGNVRPQEGKLCLVVVEGCVLPTAGLMTVSAIFAEPFLVGIIVAMACNAVAGCGSMWFVCPVASRAGKGAVFAFECEVSAAMIESLCCEPDDIRLPATVLRMTRPAIDLRAVLLSAVEAFAGTDIGGYLVVTYQAEVGLGAAIECEMATLAVLFGLDMSLCNRSRHDEHLEIYAQGGAGRQTQGDEEGKSEATTEKGGPVVEAV